MQSPCSALRGVAGQHRTPWRAERAAAWRAVRRGGAGRPSRSFGQISGSSTTRRAPRRDRSEPGNRAQKFKPESHSHRMGFPPGMEAGSCKFSLAGPKQRGHRPDARPEYLIRHEVEVLAKDERGVGAGRGHARGGREACLCEAGDPDCGRRGCTV